MKRLLFFLLLCASAFAVTETRETTALFGEKTAAATVEVARSWQVLSVLALMISAILVAIAYAVGTGFEVTEIKAWASAEMSQVIANALIIAALIATLAFIDVVVFFIASESGISTLVPECMGSVQNSSASCLQAVTAFYFKDHIDAAQKGATNVVENNMDAARWPGMRFGLYCTSIYCLQIGATTSFTGHYILDIDRYNILFEYYTNLLGFMEAQKFFVEQIGFNMGPLVLAAGIVGRCFFITRKLGGLLMAAAIGCMFFLPGMYIFDWLTLDMALKGDKALEDPMRSCPAECLLQPPVAVIVGETPPESLILGENALYSAFLESDFQNVVDMMNGTLQFAQGTNPDNPLTYNKNIKSCYYGAAKNCTIACRELPYPTTSNCVNGSMPFYCNAVPDECRVRRLVQPDEQDRDALDACPQTCKVIPPLRSDCNVGLCLNSSYDCRQTKSSNLAWRPTKSNAGADVQAKCAWAANCPASMNASQSCVYVMPPTGTCNDLCQGCPSECRIANLTTADILTLPETCINSTNNYKMTFTNSSVCHSHMGSTFCTRTLALQFKADDEATYSAACTYSDSGLGYSAECTSSDYHSFTTQTCTAVDRGNFTEFTVTCTGGMFSQGFVARFNNLTSLQNTSLNTSMSFNSIFSSRTYNASCWKEGSGYRSSCKQGSGTYSARCLPDGPNITEMSCKNISGTERSQCRACAGMCKVTIGDLKELDEQADAQSPPACAGCPIVYRLLHSGLPDEYLTGDCSLDACPGDFRAILPRKACERCVFTEETYIYDPPLNTRCGDICKPPDETPTKNPGDYSKIGAEGYVGKQDIQDLAKLMMPGYLLPLFNIVATVVFIKGLSTFLGGDIEIPGLSKVF